jgi:hypothetical protein
VRALIALAIERVGPDTVGSVAAFQASKPPSSIFRLGAGMPQPRSSTLAKFQAFLADDDCGPAS